jgi:hypothetical protein
MSQPLTDPSEAGSTADERPGLTTFEALRASQLEIAQLTHALDSRVPIEQAKGYVAAAAGVPIPRAFAALRKYSRDHNRKLREVCAELVTGRLADEAAVIRLARDE